MKPRYLFFLLLIVPALSVLLPDGAVAAPGDLDRDFGKHGLVQTKLGKSSGQTPSDSLIQPDGKILVVGRTSSGGTAIAARYLPDGETDQDFGTDGFAEFEGLVFDSVTLDDSGRIVIAGHDGDRGIVTRLMPDGSLDTGFASGGLFSSRFNLKEDESDATLPESPRLSGLEVLPDGTIYAAGKGEGCDYDCEYSLLLHLDENGSPLTIAGRSGTVARSTQSLSAIDILPDGRLVIADRDTYSDGYDSWDVSSVSLYAAPASDGSVPRLWTKGFDSDPVRPGAGGQVTPAPDGGFYLASGGVVYKATATGPDLDFGKRGVAEFRRQTFRGATRNAPIRADDLVIDPHGNLVVAGIGSGSGYSFVFLARLTADGIPDPTFDNDGYAIKWSWSGKDSFGLIRPRVMLNGADYLLTGSAGEYGDEWFGIAAVKGGTAPTASCDGRPATWLGTKKREEIYVASGVIVTRGGNDRIHVVGDREGTVVCAGSGNDRIYLKGGTAFGESGDDRIEGPSKKDRRTKELPETIETMHGGPGTDYLSGFAGDDRIFGDEGSDTILGGDGEDDLFGGAGRDEIAGEEGNDHLFGGPARDHLEGGPTIRPRSYYAGKLGKTEAELTRVGRTIILTRIKTPTSCGISPYLYWYSIRKPLRIDENGKFGYLDTAYDSEELQARLDSVKITGRYMYVISDDYDTCWTGKGLLRPWVRFKADFVSKRIQIVRQ